jgi:hypothetical protein
MVRRPTRRPCRFDPACEALESRRLLSALQAGYSVGALPTPIVGRPAVAAIPFVTSPSPEGFAPAQVRSGYAVPQIPLGTGAGSDDDLSGGVGSLQFNFVITGLAASNNGILPATTINVTSAGSVVVAAAPTEVIFIAALPTAPANGGTSNPGPSSNVGPTSTPTSTSASTPATSIAPLTPIVLTASTAAGRSTIVVILVPQVPIARLGHSTAPVTNQSLLATGTRQDLPTSSTQFGQGPQTDPDELVPAQPGAVPLLLEPAAIDYVEPFQPAGPEAAPALEGQPALPTAAARARAWPALSDPDAHGVVDLSAWDRLSEWLGTTPTRSELRPEESRPTWGLSTLFGVTAVATGGYHLALRQADGLQGRWVPGRFETGPRRTGRRSGSPAG